MKAYLITYKLSGTDAVPGKAVVVAHSAHDATERFFDEWQTEFQNDEDILPLSDLENLTVEPICSASEVYTAK